MYRTLLALFFLLLAHASVPTHALAQAGPVETYRAWWASGLAPADPGSERFRSRASIRELAVFRAEAPEIAAEALAFMAEAHGELVRSAVPGLIEIVTDDGEEVTLRVGLEGRDGPLPSGLPSEATVVMVREADDWKIHRETFRGTLSPGGDSSLDVGWEEECPVDTEVVGPGAIAPGSPSRIVVHGADADRLLHPGGAYLLRDDQAATLHLPPFGENHLRVEAGLGGSEAGTHRAVLAGMRWSGGCPALSEALVHDDAPAGQLEWEHLHGPGRARVSFVFPDPDTGAPLLSGILDDLPLLDMTPAPLLPGSMLVTRNGQEIVPDRGQVLLHEGEDRLAILLEYRLPNGGGSMALSVPGFRGGPGVHVGSPWFDTLDVTIVTRFDGRSLELEVREIPESALPKDGLDAETARSMGSLKARVVTDQVVVLPHLPPMEG
ncbi:hypothetical protein BH23GEM11_BH23GEM11_19610 [soil metagenome]